MSEIWTPPQKVDPNVMRMAWALFLKAWEKACERASDLGNVDPSEWAEVYKRCIDVAEELEKINDPPAVNPDELARETPS